MDESDQATSSNTESVDETHKVNLDQVLNQRRQPMMELVYSEESYVKRLKIVIDSYIPANNYSSMDPSEIIAKNSSTQPPPNVPQGLVAKWRILWGNWVHLYEWHSSFLEKLLALIERDPDKIPKLFIDSRARLRSIYSKYCENHRRAACIAEKHREYFQELRLYIGDKEDVVSHLMQPVQRIMRYQLPITEIVKYTERAELASINLWRKALEIMKEIPRDTSLILEAAGIEGFPGVITALGSVRIRGPLSIAIVNQATMIEVMSARNKQISNLKTSKHTAENSSDASLDASERLTNQTEITDFLANSVTFHQYTVFLFDQMLLITEEYRQGGRKKTDSLIMGQQQTFNDTFSQSTFQFKAAIKVNKMKLVSEWWQCAKNIPACKSFNLESLFGNCSSPEYGTIDGRFAFWESGSSSVTSMNLSKQLTSDNKASSHGIIYYVIDPMTLATREAWLKQLGDIHRMQQQMLIALQDPTKFGTPTDYEYLRDSPQGDNAKLKPHQGQRHKSAQTAPISQIAANCGLRSHQPQENASKPAIATKKWPSFRIKRPNILSFASNSSSTQIDTPQTKDKTSTPLILENDATSKTSLLRSQSVDRRSTHSVNMTSTNFLSKSDNIPKDSGPSLQQQPTPIANSQTSKMDSIFSLSRSTASSMTSPNSLFHRNKKKTSTSSTLAPCKNSQSTEECLEDDSATDPSEGTITVQHKVHKGFSLSHNDAVTSKKRGVLATLKNVVGKSASAKATHQPSNSRKASTLEISKEHRIHQDPGEMCMTRSYSPGASIVNSSSFDYIRNPTDESNTDP